MPLQMECPKRATRAVPQATFPAAPPVPPTPTARADGPTVQTCESGLVYLRRKRLPLGNGATLALSGSCSYAGVLLPYLPFAAHTCMMSLERTRAYCRIWGFQGLGGCLGGLGWVCRTSGGRSSVILC